MRWRRVEVSPGFLLLAAWLNYVDNQGMLWGIMISCVLHELGHLAVLSLLRVPIKRIRITAIGAEICVGREMSYRGELLTVLMGPAVNFALAALLSRVPGGSMLAGMNLTLGCFNLFPVGRLDGGRALRCLLGLTVGAQLGERLMQCFSYVSVFVLCAAGCCLLRFGGNLTLLLAAGWLCLTVSYNGGKRKN